MLKFVFVFLFGYPALGYLFTSKLLQFSSVQKTKLRPSSLALYTLSSSAKSLSFNSADIAKVQANKIKLNKRTKMGPGKMEQRRASIEDASFVGRVSVYCVGASIDLKALRAHVFRRGFGVPMDGELNSTPTPVLKLPSGGSVSAV